MPQQTITPLWQQLRKQAEHAPQWSEQLEDSIYRTLAAALSHLQMEQATFKDILEKSGNGQMVFAHAFEQFATDYSDAADQSFIEEYLQHHADTLSPFSKTYLQALTMTPPQLWQVRDITPSGQLAVSAVDEEGSGSVGSGEDTDDSPVFHVATDKQIDIGQYVLARLVPIAESAYFGIRALVLSAEDAAEVGAMMRQTKEEIIRYFNQASDDGEVDSDHLPAFADGLVGDDLPIVAFNLWAAALCREYGQGV